MKHGHQRKESILYSISRCQITCPRISAGILYCGPLVALKVVDVSIRMKLLPVFVLL